MARITKAQQAEIDAAAIVEAQQAELKRLRAEKRKAAKLAAQAPTAQPEAAKVNVAQEAVKLGETIQSLLDSIEMPSWKRWITGFVLGIAAASGVGYLVGVVAGLLMVGILAATSMVWLAWVVYVLSLIVAFYVGGKIGGIVYEWVTMKKVDAQFDAAKKRVSGWFSSSKEKVEAFSGAHTAAV